MEHLNKVLWDTFPENGFHKGPEIEREPKTSVIPTTWQIEMCQKLGVLYHSPLKQPANIVEHSLSGYQPWETESIIGNGNCLFRCLSKIITGCEESNPQICYIITSFIASEGITKIGWYFRTKCITPVNYFLNEHCTLKDKTWGGAVEIMTDSAILAVFARKD